MRDSSQSHAYALRVATVITPFSRDNTSVSRTQVSKEVQLGAELRIRQGFDEKTVTVRALSEERRGAPEAAQLYEETAASLAERTAGADERRLQRAGDILHEGRPSKRDRRLIHQFRERHSES